MTRLRIPREDWHLPDVAEQLRAPRPASLVLSGLTGMVRKQRSPKVFTHPGLLTHPSSQVPEGLLMSIALPLGPGRSRVTPPAPPLLPMPLAVELDDSEWAILTGECGSCCRPVAECCGGCQGRFCQVCRDRR